MPPDFLHGSCDPHPANDEKRHRLYRLFWGLMSDIGYFRDPEYLRRKEARTARDDTREILPPCVIEVNFTATIKIVQLMHTPTSRRYVDATPVMMASKEVICQHLKQIA